MSSSWELICDHTYTGIPGVVVDRSPSGASYGQMLGLDDTDFLKDGASAGSGAVRFYKPGSVYVSTEKSQWRALGAIRGEVTLRRQPATTAFLIDGDTFEFHIRSGALVAWFSSYPVQYAEIVSSFDAVGPQPYQIPVGQWVTLGFMHDGVRTLELYADGAVIARKTGTYAPIDAPGSSGLNIGNTRVLDSPLNGEIDTVRIWRFNPRKPLDDFARRPMDPRTAECWTHFLHRCRRPSRAIPTARSRCSRRSRRSPRICSARPWPRGRRRRRGSAMPRSTTPSSGTRAMSAGRKW